MSGQVYWTLELEIKGDAADFAGLMNDMVEATQANEPGTINYEWSTSDDGKICHIYECYGDSDAVMTHLGTFGDVFAGRFFEILKPVRFVVFGAPRNDVKEALAGLNPTCMHRVAGFSR